jgi:hypothetical protein
MPTSGEEWLARPPGGIGPGLTFWFFCVKAKEQKKQGTQCQKKRTTKPCMANAKEHLLPKDHIILTFIYIPAA